MILEEVHLEQGEWLNRPESIGKNERGSFTMGNGCHCAISGYVRWNMGRHDNFSIKIYKPVDGTTRFDVNSPDRYKYTISGDPLEEHAIVDVSFYKLELD